MWKKYINVFDNIEAILISLVLSVNVLRIFLGVSDTNLLLYLVYVFALFVLYIKYHKKIVKMIKSIRSLKMSFAFIVFIILYSIISLLWSNYESAILTCCKFIVALILAFLCIFVPSDKIKAIGVYFVLLNIIYSILCLTMMSRVTLMFGNGMNYLNATLTLGFSFSIALVSLLIAFFNKNLLLILCWISLSALFFISLLSFIARGVLIFPPIIALCMIPFIGKNHLRRTIFILGISIVIGYFAIQYFMDLASDYGASRMLRLFEDAEEEDRFELWQQCSFIMIEKYWYFFGGGICAFSSTIYYPHNIFLQILGEFGIIPLIVFLYMIITLFLKFFKLNKHVSTGGKWPLYFVFVGMLYYILTFSKSFSLYDALPLFIMMALLYGFHIDKAQVKPIKYETKDSRILQEM